MALPKVLTRNYWFPAVNPLVGGGEGITRTEDPQHIERYIAKVQLQRIRQDVASWRESVNEAELAYYPHRVKMQRLFNDTVLNGHVYACMEKRKSLTLLKKWQIVNINGETDEYWSEKFNHDWARKLMNYSLDALFYGYNLINFSSIEDDKMKDIRVIKRHNVSPDRLQVVSYVYDLSGIQFTTDENFKEWVVYIDTPSENGISKCGYGLLYRCAIYEIFLRNLLGYNGDYVELYSQPVRIAKTMKTTEEERGELENMMRNLGSAGWGIFDPTDEIDLLESKNAGTGWQGYENLEKRCEAKISKIILGHADAMDSVAGKLGNQEEAKDALRTIEKLDTDFISNVFNDKVLPLLRDHGMSIPEDYRFEFCNDLEVEEAEEKRNKRNLDVVSIVKTLSDSGYKVDPAQIEEMTGLKIEEKEPVQPDNFNNDIQNKLNSLYDGI